MGFCEDCHESFASIEKNLIITSVHIQSIDKNIEQQNVIFTKICGTLSDISASLKAKIELDKKIHNLVPSTD